MNKNIIIAILIIIIVALVAVFGMGLNNGGKTGTEINFVNGDHIKNGESVTIELKDANGNILSNENVNFTFTENNTPQNYSVITDSQGKAYLQIADEKSGEYDISASFAGNDKLQPCEAHQKVKIESGEANETSTESNATASTTAYNKEHSGSSATQTYYDAELNVYYDGNGRIVSGQSEGDNIYNLRNNPPIVTEDGLE